MDIELVPLATVTATLSTIHSVGVGPGGDRMVADVSGFEVRGPRLNATMKGSAAADWPIVSPDGVGTLDVRVTVETDDGALIFVAYQGRVDLSMGSEAVIYVAPRFETADPRYKWLNTVQAIGKGRGTDTGVQYEWYEVR